MTPERYSSPLMFILLLGISCTTWSTALAQSFDGGGFRLIKDEKDLVVAAEFYSQRSIKNAILEIRSELSDFAEANKLQSYPSLEVLFYRYGDRVSAEHLSHIGALDNLRSLEFGFVGMQDECVTIEGDMSVLGGLKGLEWLQLSKQNICDNDLKFISMLPKLKSLELCASTNPLGEDGPRCTDQCAEYLKQATTLESLWIEFADNFTDKFVSEITESLVNLEHFDLSSPELTDESLRLLSQRCQKLNWLDVGSDRFTDDGVKHLGKCVNLKILHIYSESLTNQCIAHIAGLSQLEHLQLIVPSVQDTDVQLLANLRELEILVLREPTLTDQQFAMFSAHPNLKSAFLNGRHLSLQQTMNVIQTIPNLEHLEIGNNDIVKREVNEALSRKKRTR